jgi:hypothetical protein
MQGMCRGEVVDVFPENEGPTDPDSLWEHLTASGRLAFAPKNEMMSDDEEVCV